MTVRTIINRVKYLNIEDLVKIENSTDKYVGVQMKYCEHWGIHCKTQIRDIVVPCKVVKVTNQDCFGACTVLLQFDECTVGLDAVIKANLQIVRFAYTNFIDISGEIETFMNEHNKALFIADGRVYAEDKETPNVVYAVNMLRQTKGAENDDYEVKYEQMAIFESEEAAKEHGEMLKSIKPDEYLAYYIKDWKVF